MSSMHRQASQGFRERTIIYSVYLLPMCYTVLSKSRHSQVQVPYKPSRVRITDAASSEDSHLTPGGDFETRHA